MSHDTQVKQEGKEPAMNNRQYLNMIWANEAGKSIWLYRGENGGMGIEIRGVVDLREQELASARIERHNIGSLIQTATLYQKEQEEHRAECSRGVRRETLKEAAAMIHNLSVPNGFEQAFGYATGLGRAEKVLLEASATEKGEMND